MEENLVIKEIYEKSQKMQAHLEKFYRDRGLLVDNPTCGWHYDAREQYFRQIRNMREQANRDVFEYMRIEALADILDEIEHLVTGV